MKKKLFGSVFVAALAMFSLAATSIPANAATSAAVWTTTVNGVSATLPCFPCVASLGAADVTGSISAIGEVQGTLWGPTTPPLDSHIPPGPDVIGVGGAGTNIAYSEPTCVVGIATGTLGSTLGVVNPFAYLRVGATAAAVGLVGTTAVIGVLVFSPANPVDAGLRCASVPQAVLGIPTGASATNTPFAVNFTGAGVIVGV
jgi:hypothetical protein